jgi:hypothetical protein
MVANMSSIFPKPVRLLAWLELLRKNHSLILRIAIENIINRSSYNRTTNIKGKNGNPPFNLGLAQRFAFVIVKDDE